MSEFWGPFNTFEISPHSLTFDDFGSWPAISCLLRNQSCKADFVNKKNILVMSYLASETGIN